jgi:hypothetical protein
MLSNHKSYHAMKTYPKQRHTFPKDPHKNPEGPMTAWVYNGLHDPAEPYANYIIEEIEHLGDPAFMLVLENSSFIKPRLEDLEPLLFKWLEDEGVRLVHLNAQDASETPRQMAFAPRKCPTCCQPIPEE